MMDLSTVSLKNMPLVTQMFTVFSGQTSSTSQTVLSLHPKVELSPSCYHLWTEAEYWRHLKLSITALDRTTGSGLRFVLETEFIKPVLHRSRTP